MARTLEELTTFFSDKKVEGADDLVSDIKALIAAETETGKKASKKKNKEAEALRTALKKAEPLAKFVTEKLGFDPEEDDLDDLAESVEKAMKGLSSDDDDDDDDTGGKKKKGKGKGKPSPEFLELQKTVKTLQKNFNTEKTAREAAEKTATELQDKNRRRIIGDRLMKGLKDDKGQPRLFGADLVVRGLIEDKKVGLKDDGETVVFIKGSGDDAEEIDFDEGIKNVIAERKDLQVNAQQPGGGTTGGGVDVPPDKQSDADRLKKLRNQQQPSVLA
jgi:hypothetical protein